MLSNKALIARCLKITQKVESNIASEANYVYILGKQKSLFLSSFKTVLPERSTLIWQKIGQNTKFQKIQMRHFWWFSNIVCLIAKLTL